MKIVLRHNDHQLAELYRIARDEGVLGVVATDVDIVCEAEFLNFARRNDVFLAAGYDDESKPLGFFYLTNVEGDTARIHFCIFKAGKENRRELGRQVIGWCFDTFVFKCLIGVVPVINRGACRYAGEVGGKEMGIIPGICWIERLKRSVGGVQFIFERS